MKFYKISGLFLLLFSILITLSPAGRERTWAVDYQWSHWAGAAVWLIVFYWVYRAVYKNLNNPDPLLLPLAGLMSGWGLLTIWRIVPALGQKQAVWLIFSGALIVLGVNKISDLSFLRQYKYLWLSGGLVLTALTLFFGTNPLGYGPRLWLGCCGLYLQPSEPLKLLLIIFLSAYLADRQPLTKNLRSLLLPTLLMIGVILALLVAQRDLGTASIFAFIYAAILFIATGKKRILWASLAGLYLAGMAGYWLFDVVRVRVEAWLNPWLDPSGNSYQIIQSLMAIASGGMLGRGPGLGNPSLVPVAHSDFIFSSIAEENGLIGTLALIICYSLLTLRGLKISLSANNRFEHYLAGGLTTYFASQSLLIMGGTIRALPLTGITLPFVSYGGSSLLTSFTALLILLHLSDKKGQPNFVELSTKPIITVGRIFLISFAAIGLITGWWAVVRAEDLLSRTDNARRGISERIVPRGEILDRNEAVISYTFGDQGDYQRIYNYPEFSPVLGYTDPVYGQAGAEASLDSVLRGYENQSPWVVWYHNLLYGQPPPGLDVTLSLDIELQLKAGALLKENPGSVVVINASNGDILTMLSSPYYDANILDENWNELINDPNSPLVNRAAQGQYQPGGILGAFLLTFSDLDPNGSLPKNTRLEIYRNDLELAFDLDKLNLLCALPDENIVTWGNAISAGCPRILVSPELLGSIFNVVWDLNLDTAPDIRLQTAMPTEITLLRETNKEEALGQGALQISPLQLAIAASALSNHGVIPAPHFLLSAQGPDGEWINYPPQSASYQAISPSAADDTALALKANGQSIWEATALAYDGEDRILTWYMGGSNPTHIGDGYVIVVLLEERNPILAKEIGQQLLLSLIEK